MKRVELHHSAKLTAVSRRPRTIFFCQTPSSTQNIKDGVFQCFHCKRTIDDDDCGFLCVVCGNIECGATNS